MGKREEKLKRAVLGLTAAGMLAAAVWPAAGVQAAEPEIITKDNFDYEGYLAEHPDLAAINTRDQTDEIWNFYKTTGEPNGWEGDIVPAKLISETNFDWERYAADNPDVASALYSDPDKMYWHYVEHGFAEGRKAYSRDDSENAHLAIWKTAMSITDENMSDREKIRAVHDWIVKNTAYDIANYNAGTIPREDYSLVGVMLNHTGVCEGYADTFRYFCDVLDIECGTVASSNHAWNKVKLDGEWYYIDVTWDDPLPDGGSTVRWYKYYLSKDPTFGGESSHHIIREY